jgi:hypothetical protein
MSYNIYHHKGYNVSNNGYYYYTSKSLLCEFKIKKEKKKEDLCWKLELGKWTPLELI